MKIPQKKQTKHYPHLLRTYYIYKKVSNQIKTSFQLHHNGLEGEL